MKNSSSGKYSSDKNLQKKGSETDQDLKKKRHSKKTEDRDSSEQDEPTKTEEPCVDVKARISQMFELPPACEDGECGMGPFKPNSRIKLPMQNALMQCFNMEDKDIERHILPEVQVTTYYGTVYGHRLPAAPSKACKIIQDNPFDPPVLDKSGTGFRADSGRPYILRKRISTPEGKSTRSFAGSTVQNLKNLIFYIKAEPDDRILEGPTIKRDEFFYKYLSELPKWKKKCGTNHFVPFVDVGTVGSNRHLVTELMSANLVDLRSQAQHKFSPASFLFICRQTLQAIHDLHLHGFTHRDIRPQNFFVSATSNIIYLGNFQLIRNMDENRKVPGYDEPCSKIVHKYPWICQDFLPRVVHVGGEYKWIDDIESWIYLILYMFAPKWPKYDTERDMYVFKSLLMKGYGKDIYGSLEHFIEPMIRDLESYPASKQKRVDFTFFASLLDDMATSFKVKKKDPLDWHFENGELVFREERVEFKLMTPEEMYDAATKIRIEKLGSLTGKKMIEVDQFMTDVIEKIGNKVVDSQNDKSDSKHKSEGEDKSKNEKDEKSSSKKPSEAESDAEKPRIDSGKRKKKKETVEETQEDADSSVPKAKVEKKLRKKKNNNRTVG